MTDTNKALERVIENAKAYAGSFLDMEGYKQNEADCLTLRYWDDYKRSYSKSQFEDYFEEEIEALAILSQYGEQV